MTTLRLTICAALLTVSGTMLYGSPIVVLQPGPSISGTAGSTVGWGFGITPESQYGVSIIATFLVGESNPGLGTYTDIVSYQGGPSAGQLNPTEPDWVQPFLFNADPSLETGLGS